MAEEWKDVIDYEGLYQVSNTGKVRTVSRMIKHSRGGLRKHKQIILKQRIMPNGYHRIEVINKQGERKGVYVHRWVAQSFVKNPGDKQEVNHIDGNKSNNNANNLEWCTPKENSEHARNTGLNNNGNKIVLINKETNESFFFRSQMQASFFLGRYHSFISEKVRSGKKEADGHLIIQNKNVEKAVK
ncbi:MAG TPA: NUMOD4 domain-containing protein [Massilibacterium sp.]|nr:NUMOD4 domain-containing protein [Massilibacterium sp.]